MNNSKNYNRKGPKPPNFFIGIGLLGIGLFLFFNQLTVSSSWFSYGMFRIGGIWISNGWTVLPLVIGIVMIFNNTKSVVGKILAIIGVLLILVSIVTTVHIRLSRTSLFSYILMLTFIIGGANLIFKSLALKRN
ncbi:hypothetical protein I6N96_01270 [Enterococcus sp. BWM-S5]|uniref:Uncharacterized protein n=1 Tax=Enterococcus larvae TaxID=2794352 RepID=A0ABS4CF61_9ENTE|nr:hypothetical protein [Enterococcus larvae]MBP1044892.1 hypothetical protein [Enterococcus larvae]